MCLEKKFSKKKVKYVILLVDLTPSPPLILPGARVTMVHCSVLPVTVWVIWPSPALPPSFHQVGEEGGEIK